eukprot:maker-scaffold892_size84543-snap-gene-0.16 protein:Tk08291 transcript:maker-scaffold892_size84543-snap-gene-0.16-mRNA-1 annotation:"insulin receptor-like isoform x2"
MCLNSRPPSGGPRTRHCSAPDQPVDPWVGLDSMHSIHSRPPPRDSTDWWTPPMSLVEDRVSASHVGHRPGRRVVFAHASAPQLRAQLVKSDERGRSNPDLRVPPAYLNWAQLAHWKRIHCGPSSLAPVSNPTPSPPGVPQLGSSVPEAATPHAFNTPNAPIKPNDNGRHEKNTSTPAASLDRMPKLHGENHRGSRLDGLKSDGLEHDSPNHHHLTTDAPIAHQLAKDPQHRKTVQVGWNLSILDVLSSHWNFGFRSRSSMRRNLGQSTKSYAAPGSLTCLFLSMMVLLSWVPQSSARICSSLKIQMNFGDLEGCTVIEGNLVIMSGFETMEVKEEDYITNLTFPDLKEITDYMLVYKASRIVTFSKLFPNLSVIRGNKLLGNWALVVFQNENLVNIGFKGLTRLLHGGVKVMENPSLCYIESINWKEIINSDYHSHIDFEENNRFCPGLKCSQLCPTEEPTGRRLCWTESDCQRVERKCDESVDSDNICFTNNDGTVNTCSSECLGGCSSHDSKICWACRHVRWDSNQEIKCSNECPLPLLVYKDWRCINKSDCSHMETYNHAGAGFKEGLSFKSYDSKCIEHCPRDTKEEIGKDGVPTCKQCIDCPNPCDGGVITSLEDLKLFEDCTHVPNVVQHLERTLGRVIEIQGFLKISRVFSLNSLDFFSSLKKILGVQANEENSKFYSLIILENENLRKLFTIGKNNETVKVQRHGDPDSKGQAFIHYNPKLCKSEIKKMLRFSNMEDPGENSADISYATNGDKALCSPEKLDVTVQKNGLFLILTFSNYQEMILKQNPEADVRGLLGYEIHYREISKATYISRNQSKYGGRDACGSDGWTVIDHTPVGSNIDDNSIQFPNETSFFPVKPYTYYSIFITTLLLKEYEGTKGIQGAQSEMLYVLSNEGFPEVPRDIHFIKVNHTSLNISWVPPRAPNGKIHHYELVLELKETDEVRISEQDYCHSPLYQGNSGNPPSGDTRVSTKKKSSSQNSGQFDPNIECDCQACLDPRRTGSISDGGTDISIENRIEKDAFMDLVINRAFDSPRGLERRKRRALQAWLSSNETIQSKLSTDSRDNTLIQDPKIEEIFDGTRRTPVKANNRRVATRPNNTVVRNVDGTIKYYITFSSEVAGSRHQMLVTNLKHFGFYSLKIRACHAPKPDDEGGLVKWCSGTVPKFERVAPKPKADDIHGNLQILPHNDSDTATISWHPPTDPNDIIVKYNVRYKSKETAKYSTSCIQAYKLQAMKYRYQMPVVGNYLVSVQAVSLSGPGNWTESVFVKGPNQRGPSWVYTILVPILGIAVFVLICILLWHKWVTGKGSEPIISSNPLYEVMQYVADEWEVNRNVIVRGDELGKGAFATVYKGTYKDPRQGFIHVAMKTPKENASHNECMLFLNEAHMMKPIDTAHIIRLIGVVSVNTPYWVLLEYMALGDLKSYLKTMRPGSEYNIDGRPPPTAKEVKQMALEIADGMAYLANRPKPVVHRDLAARNCLVSCDKIVKIADFGMAREIYSIYTKNDKGMMPIRWMPPESLRGEATVASDVWSFGVVLWEMVTLGDQPYRGMSNNEVMDHVMRGGIMEQPEDCPDELYNLMVRCWHTWQSKRPTFLEICQEMLQVANERFLSNSYFTSTDGQTALDQEESRKRAAEDAGDSAAQENTPCLTKNGNSNSHSNSLNCETYSGSASLDNGKAMYVTNKDLRQFNRQNSTPNNVHQRFGTSGNTNPRFIKLSNSIFKYRNKSGSTSGEA